jgi:starvation-inducible DNA-binding protein
VSSLAFATGNDLPVTVREQVVDLLNKRLAGAIDLAAQAKQAHWNVKGPQFIALHKLFDEIHGAVQEYADVLAERVVQLGGVADGILQSVVQQSDLTAYPRALVDGPEHVNALAGALAEFAARMRRTIDETDDLGDCASADICTEIARGIDTLLWFVEAHVQGAAVGV